LQSKRSIQNADQKLRLEKTLENCVAALDQSSNRQIDRHDRYIGCGLRRQRALKQVIKEFRLL